MLVLLVLILVYNALKLIFNLLHNLVNYKFLMFIVINVDKEAFGTQNSKNVNLILQTYLSYIIYNLKFI